MRIALFGTALFWLSACNTTPEVPSNPQISDLEFLEQDLGISARNLENATEVDASELAKLKQPDLDAIAKQAETVKTKAAELKNDPLSAPAPSAAELAKMLDTRDALLLYRAIREFEDQNPEATEREKSDFLLDFYKKKKALLSRPGQNQSALESIEGVSYTLNAIEQRLYNENPTQALRALAVGYYALKLTENYWSSGIHNGNADAFRHCLWNIYMCNAVDCAWARKWADAHEDGALGQPSIEYIMDQFNNNAGRELHASYGTYADMWVPTATWNGYLRRLGPSGLVPTDRSGYRY